MKNKSVPAKKHLGQNFLQSEDVVRDIAESIPSKKPLIIVEVGPGLGMLTQALSKVAAKVIAYEIDESLKDAMAENLEDCANVEVRFRDFMKVNLEEELPEEPDYEYAFSSNLPYYITTPILFKVLESKVPFTSVTVMMQKEVADRFLAKEKSPDYNDLSVISQYLCEVRKVRNVGRQCFRPVPNVDSTVIQFVKRAEKLPVSDEEGFFSFVKGMFAFRRKTVLNNLGVITKDKELAGKILEDAGIDPKRRPQECSVTEFIRLYERYAC
ncbi:MAG: ribosomal RNA small subunit methyltransferase A [Erysipelotrichales bacterium]|nr:ribosomal RNA small subunit methyltransferase A [Erysipelotrichales bacterium]MBQ1505600.1 ribosomal RNA small subunit methyltransferase A [Erysipelotrichales bacterium]